MLGDMTPFRIAGNLYFVGEYAASCHMIDTGEGLILLDVGYEKTADIVIESLSTLGYDVADVKYILLSHGHYDHSDGVPKIVARSGAKVLMGRGDDQYLKGFLPDAYLSDGDVITLGNTSILCLHTPGHTEGTFSFFFELTENQKTLRAGMFGGAGTPQLKKEMLDQYGLPYRLRKDFLDSIKRLREEKVDLFIGNHSWQNHTRENYEKMQTAKENPFVSTTRFAKFLDSCEKKLDVRMLDDSRENFVNYAHRGASEYLPENTFSAFYQALLMGANGIETDVRRTKDGRLVLFHDSTLERVTNGTGKLEDYTYDELSALTVTKQDFSDRIVLLEDFLQKFAFRPITFAIELKADGIEGEVADLLRRYEMEKKTVVTSFSIDRLRNFKAYAPEFRVGFLTKEINDKLLCDLRAFGVDEICPLANTVNTELVSQLHREGFRVRAWGLTRDLISTVYDSGADGMTVNFPDLLSDYIQKQSQ